MTEEVKKRIEDINNGIVPEGYKNSKYGFIPLEWKIVSLKDCLNEYREISNDIDKYPVYSSSRKGLIPQSDYYDQKESVQTNMGYKIVPVGYVTYRHMSDDDIFHFNLNDTQQNVLVSIEYPVFNTNHNSDLYYIITNLNEMPRFKYFCRGQKQGGTRTRLYYKNLLEYELALPPLSEQKKIADILRTQDIIILNQEQKVEELKNLKKAYLTKMFPQKGSKYPEIRFKEFTDAWEQRKVKDISNYIDGNYGEKYPRDDEFIDSGIPFFTSAVTGSEGIFNENNIKYISFEKNNELTKAQSQGGDLILTNRGASMGVIAEIPEKYGLVNIGPQLTRIRGKGKIANNKYLLYLFQTPTNNKKLTSMNAGSAMPFIGLKGLGDIDLLIPQYDEQIKIGNYFSNLDYLITLHQRKLEAEKKKKKALMQLLLTGKVRVKV